MSIPMDPSMAASEHKNASSKAGSNMDKNQVAAVDEQTRNSEKFAALTDQFMKESLLLSPSTASQVGYHKHTDPKTGKTIELDALLDEMSAEAMKTQRQFYASWRERFNKEVPKNSLSTQDAADWQLVDDQIGLQLLEFDKIQNYKHNPTVAVELIGGALFQPLTEDYAPKDVRLGHIISRIGQIPRLLREVQTYIDNSDPIFVSTAIDENDGNIDMIENTIGKELEGNAALKAAFDKVAPNAVQALKDYSKWLKKDLAKKPNDRSWRLGQDLYAQKFKLVMEANLTPDELLADAEKELKSVRAEMLQLALPLYKQYYPDKGEHKDLPEAERQNLIISAVIDKISENHPKRDQLQQAIEADLEMIKEFIREKKIVSLSSRDNLKVTATPLFYRGVLSVAAFHSAPALNPKAQAEYWVTPIDPSVPEAKAESKLREYNNFTLKWLTIHEALPGHYIQFEHLNNIQPERRRLLRSLYANGAYVEGWAEYIAQVMMDEGFMKDDPRFRIIMKKIRLRVLSNSILDIRMQTKNMTDEQAMDLLTKQTFQTQAEAEGKLKRAKLTSAQLPTYYLGLREWLKFRKRYQDKMGSKFDLLKFHNQVLDEGPLPVPIIEQIVN
jgi:uncharacterized protein (DUF885 family)